MNAMEQAREQSRRAIESMYEDSCTVIEYSKVKNPNTRITDETEITVLENVPCKISFSSVNQSEQTESANSVKQLIKLFLSPDIEIKSGSKIVVSHSGRNTTYKNSGIPAIFCTHQEITLEIFKEWA